jgi:hypothetical protein
VLKQRRIHDDFPFAEYSLEE